jgi:hypothetical protein
MSWSTAPGLCIQRRRLRPPCDRKRLGRQRSSHRSPSQITEFGLELRSVEMDIERFGSSPRLSAAREFSPEYRENKRDDLLRRREVRSSLRESQQCPATSRATVRKGTNIVYTFLASSMRTFRPSSLRSWIIAQAIGTLLIEPGKPWHAGVMHPRRVPEPRLCRQAYWLRRL